ncbi:MAG: ribonuclease III [Lachnospiraceae bacterium]|nr:ribonuclease III [Lachnospiraceae bacterium]
MEKDLNRLEETIRYRFNDRALLKQALVHPSYSGEMKLQRYESNQRLEFLGDAVLELAVSEYLYKAHPMVEEGELTRKRSSLVFETALEVCARSIGLGDYLYLGHGEDISRGREKPSILSDAFEAVIGAVYVDGGFEAACRFIDRFVIEQVDELALLKDGKSLIQEYVQRDVGGMLEYRTEALAGPDHMKSFHSELYINQELAAEGYGHSKKNAEQDAARKACISLKLV